jgi:D-alanyl-D-alanine dipeptidase
VPNRQALSISRLFLAFCLSTVPVQILAQSPSTPALSIEPGSKPPDVSTAWKQLVGIYGQAKEPSVVILERDNVLFWRLADGNEWPVSQVDATRYSVSPAKPVAPQAFVVRPDSTGAITALRLQGQEYVRTDAGSDPTHFYHVTPVRPLSEIRAEALRASPPAEPGPFREPDLVELVSLDPAFHLDIRYAQSDNFLSTPSYTEARAFMQRPAAEALLRALNKVIPLGYGFLVHDAYRPWYVTKIFWDATPPAGHDFVADPQKGSKHNRGCAVDITLYDLATGKPVEMPGLYDEMSPRSFPNFPGGTSLQRWHRELLRHAIESEGFTVDGNEWWHYDYKDWKHYPIMNVPFEKLGKG